MYKLRDECKLIGMNPATGFRDGMLCEVVEVLSYDKYKVCVINGNLRSQPLIFDRVNLIETKQNEKLVIDDMKKFDGFLIDNCLYYKPGGWPLCSKEENRKFSIEQAEQKYNVNLIILKNK